MPLFIVKNNIVKMDVDAIVKPADSTPIGQGRTALRIHHAAGPELTGACLMLGNWPAGESRMTEGFQLRARHVAHTRVPAWDGGGENRWEQLASCYRTALELADREGCESVAVPLLSAELPGWPAERGLRTAMDTIAAFLNDHDMTVSLVVKDRESFQVDSGLAARLGRFVAENYRPDSRGIKDVIYDSLDEDAPRSPGFLGVGAVNAGVFGLFHKGRILEKLSSKLQDKLDDKLKHADEGFSEMLLRKIREQGRTETEVYKKANIDRKLFSKIRSDRGYKPKKSTVVAFAMALELPYAEMEEMLKKSGYALDPSVPFDIIVDFFFKEEIYDVYELNQMLFKYDQELVGGGRAGR